MDHNEALRDVQTIRTLAKGLSRTRDSIYLLLKEIYRVGRKWLKSNKAKELRDAVIGLKSFRIDSRARKNIFRFLIEVGYPVRKTYRSRYANALRYAHAHNCPSENLARFITSRGGIEECDKLFRALQRKRSREQAQVHLKRGITW